MTSGNIASLTAPNHSPKPPNGRILSHTHRAVKTIFLGPHLKDRMLRMEENFFRRAFLVDVHVDTIKGRPALYKIAAIHDTVEIPDDTGAD